MDELLKFLREQGGAVLYWQLSDSLAKIAKIAVDEGKLVIDDCDLLVHPDARQVCEGSYEI